MDWSGRIVNVGVACRVIKWFVKVNVAEMPRSNAFRTWSSLARAWHGAWHGAWHDLHQDESDERIEGARSESFIGTISETLYNLSRVHLTLEIRRLLHGVIL